MVRLSKRFWIRVGLGLGTGLAGLGATYVWLLPAIVRGRAEKVIQHRLGMNAQIGGASMGLGSATLERVVLTGRHGALRVVIGELEAHAGLGVVVRGAAAVDRIVAKGVDVRADLTRPGAKASLQAIRQAWAGGRGEGTSSKRPKAERPPDHTRRYRLEGLEVHAQASGGRRLDLSGGTVLYAGGRLTAEAHHLSAVLGRGHRVDLVDPSGEAVHRPSGWRLSSLEVASGTVLLRQAAPDASGDAVEAASAQRSPARRVGREQGLRDLLVTAFEHVSDDADVHLARLRVDSETAGGRPHPVLDDLDVALHGQGPGVVVSTGSGRAAGGGRIRWKVQVRPREARAEGRLTFHRLSLALVAPALPDLPWYQPEQAELDGNLVIAAESPTSLSVRGQVALDGAALYSPKIAPDPIQGISISLAGRGHWIPARRRLVIDSGEFTSGNATLHLGGAIEWAADHYLIDLKATLPPTPCGAAVHAIPADLLGETAGFGFQGQLAGALSVHVDSRDLKDTKLDIHVADGCQFVTIPAMADLRRFRGIFVQQVEEPNGSVFQMTTGPGSDNWQPIRSVSPYLVQAVIAHEDGAFFRHHGFAPWAIQDALARDLQAGRFVVGASTISMQLAKNLFLRREKTLARKVQEVLLTWWLESELDKADILELYLNVIEFGPSVYGIKHAASYYFGRSPSDLSPGESAFLATILPDPEDHQGAYKRGEPSASTKNRMRRLLQHMADKQLIDQDALAYGLSEVDSMRFHHEGDPPPPPRTIPGHAAPLPFGISDEAPDQSPGSWEGAFGSPSAVGGQTSTDATKPHDPFRALPRVDPDAL